MAESTEWVDPYAGFEYTAETISVTPAYQSEKLSGIGIEPSVFGHVVDPSFFIGIAINSGIRSGITAEGNVNMVQQLVQHRPALLDEDLTVSGRIADVRRVPRGRTLHSEVMFYDQTGEPVIEANRVSLKPDPDKSNRRGAGERPAPLVNDPSSMLPGPSFQLTPENVAGYSSEGNSIHYEEEAARKAGFRAPLIGGGMGVHFLLAHIWAQETPKRLRLSIYFRRPVFWDETVTVSQDLQQSPTIMALLKPDGKVGTELSIERG
ncbi:MAG: hypothetical protein AAF541_19390 [Pseudomonadota bacterium]